MRRGLIVLLALLCGCSSRTLPSVDGGGSRDRSASKTDGPLTCSRLVQVGQVSLQQGEDAKTGPSVAFDGERFVVLWQSQKPVISSTNGLLRFAYVDQSGKTDTKDGVVLDKSDVSLRPALLAGPGVDTTVLNRPSGADVFLTRFGGEGEPENIARLDIAKINQVAMAPHPKGYAVFLADSFSPQVIVVDHTGASSKPRHLVSNMAMASLWIVPHSGGFAAAAHSSASTLYLLDQDGGELGRAGVGNGALARSPAFTLRPGGLAAAYVHTATKVELELYDSTGKPASRHPLGLSSLKGPAARQIAAANRGGQLFVAYPGAGVPGRFMVQIVDAKTGALEGSAIPLSNCLAVANTVSMAWGRERLAIVTVNSTSGLPHSSVCVTLMACQ